MALIHMKNALAMLQGRAWKWPQFVNPRILALEDTHKYMAQFSLF
jgi:hypothetical protein